MKRDLIPLAVLDGRHAGGLLAHPCHCSNPRCLSLGEHLWDSTRNMAPGPQAQAFEPRSSIPSTTPRDSDPPPDPTGGLHDTYNRLLNEYQRSANILRLFIERNRPDRTIPLPDPSSDDDWCTNHLTLIGVCEPRYRGDCCRRCYDIQLTYGFMPDRMLLIETRDRGRITPSALNDFLIRNRPTRRKRKKAS